MLSPHHHAWLRKTVQSPTQGGAAHTALQLGYITHEEWEELRGLRDNVGRLWPSDAEAERNHRLWRNLRRTLACFVLLAEGHELEV